VSARKRIVVLGAGGQARETRWTIEELNRIEPTFEFVGYAISDLAKLTHTDSKSDVRGDFGWLRSMRTSVDALALGIGTPAARLKVARELQESFTPEAWPTLIHPTAIIDRTSVKHGRGVFISAGVVATVNVVLGDFCMLNFGCTVGHEASIGAGSVVNPGANISGGVELGEGVLVGTGAQVLQYVRVGAGATIGAGAVVTQDVPAGATVVGVPARPLERKP